MQKWDYRVVIRNRTILGEDGQSFRNTTNWNINNMEPALQSLGQEGWELVSAMPQSDFGSQLHNYGGPIVAGVTTSEIWVFKRPVE